MAQQKIDFFGKFSPTGVDTSGADRLRALAGLSAQAGELAFQVGAKKRAQEGAGEGMQVQRDESGQLIAPEKKSELTIYGENFNKSARMAYRAAIATDAKERLARFKRDNPDDVEGFNSLAQQYKTGALQGMPEDIAGLVSLDLDSAIASHRADIEDTFFKNQTRQQQADVLAGIDSVTDDLLNAVRKGNTARITQLTAEHSRTIAEGIEAGLIDPVAANDTKEQLAERIQEQQTLGELDRTIFNDELSTEEKLANGLEFVDNLREADLEELSPEQKDSLLGVVGAKVANLQAKLNQEKAERSIELDRRISDITIAARNNLGNPEELVQEINGLHTDGSITGEKRASLITSILQGQKANADKLAGRSRVAEKDQPGSDPSIVLTQAEVDDYYDNVLEPTLDPESKTERQSLFIDRTRMVPKKVKAEITNNILSDDPDLIRQSADLVDRIDEIPGMAGQVLTKNQEAFMSRVVGLSEAMAPAEAVQLARKLTDTTNKALVKSREVELKELKKGFTGIDYQDVVDDEFSTFLGSDPARGINQERMAMQYKELFESYYLSGMEQSDANDKAVKVMNTNWKDGEFGFMQYRPEDYYSVAGSVDYVREQLNRDVADGFIGISYSNENIHLLSDDITARNAAKGKPDYRVMVIDDNGEMQFLGRWRPDQAAEQETVKVRLEEEAIEKREKQKSPLKGVDLRRVN